MTSGLGLKGASLLLPSYKHNHVGSPGQPQLPATRMQPSSTVSLQLSNWTTAATRGETTEDLPSSARPELLTPRIVSKHDGCCLKLHILE